MIEIIDDVMDHLARRAHPFGAGSQGTNCMAEDELQEAMHEALIAAGIPDCHRELGFRSFRFVNKRQLKLDIAANGFGIELKYVSNGLSGRPSDGQAFPYHVILDCARIEVMINDALRSQARGSEIPLRDAGKAGDPTGLRRTGTQADERGRMPPGGLRRRWQRTS